MTSKSLIVGVDGSPGARTACRFAVDMGRAIDASIVAVHAWQTPFVCTYPGGSWSPEEAKKHGQRLLTESLDEAQATGRVETRVRRGMPGPTMCAESSDADLTVIGSTGRSSVDLRSRLGEVLFGSTARYLASHAAGAVAVVPAGSGWVDHPSVVVGVDGSPTSLEALRWAASELPESASIRAVQAIVMPPMGGEVPVDAELLDQLVERYHRVLDEFVDQAAGGSADRGSALATRSISTHVVLGTAQDALLKPGFNVDMIVIGRHGKTAATKNIGSVSDHTLRNSAVPVVIVPPNNLGQQEPYVTQGLTTRNL